MGAWLRFRLLSNRCCLIQTISMQHARLDIKMCLVKYPLWSRKHCDHFCLSANAKEGEENPLGQACADCHLQLGRSWSLILISINYHIAQRDRQTGTACLGGNRVHHKIFFCLRTGTLKVCQIKAYPSPLVGAELQWELRLGPSIPGLFLGFPHPEDHWTKPRNPKLLQLAELSAAWHNLFVSILNVGLHAAVQAIDEGRLRKPRTLISSKYHYQTQWA